ncbi:hypothetical protein GJ744_003959 [Endocarpon pusillum]|uniref:Oxysterol-binding protein-like protein 1 n=1 Tax=Endocarpon pusillum TaxID=364733 RepID=A0A8H7E0B6_9EURO|nr:hypothetical protein GJ744_003959 [Endocarpon pusillum]
MASASSGSTEFRASPVPSTASSTVSLNSASTPPTTPASDKPADEGSKLRMFLSILRKFIGVSDIAAVRFSLPAQLLEPTPNLEYWHYLDRPETFASIGKSDDEVGRMLEVLRFWFTKDLKYVKGKPCKPYNSALGEFFRCHWDIVDDAPPLATSSTASQSAPNKPEDSVSQTPARSSPIRVSYLTEQTSHHPPVSAFFVDCPARGVSARGYDQLSAKFTGTAIRVTPGAHNLGIFITLAQRGNEEYQLTHPAAQLGGLLRGALAVSVSDVCFVTCPKTRIKVILHYLEEGWLGKSQNRVQGVMFRYEPDNDKYTRIKDVPQKDILAHIDGCWQERVYYSIPSTPAVKNAKDTDASNNKHLLVDLTPLVPVPKTVPPEEDQLSNESRRFWKDVTDAISNKQYGEATRVKQALEQQQRDKAEERKARNEEWKPRYFAGAVVPKGRPDLSKEGQAALKGLQEGKYRLEDTGCTGV